MYPGRFKAVKRSSELVTDDNGISNCYGTEAGPNRAKYEDRHPEDNFFSVGSGLEILILLQEFRQ